MKNPFYRFKLQNRSIAININLITSYSAGDNGSLCIWVADNENAIIIPDFSVVQMDFLLERHFDYEDVREATDAIKN
jgi:hypothetical protein